MLRMAENNPDMMKMLQDAMAVGYKYGASGMQQNNMPNDQNMQEGGLVTPGQNPMDPPVSSPTADNLQRNLSEGEFVLPQPVVQAIGQDTLQKLSGAVEQLMGTGQDVGMIREAIEMIVNEVQSANQPNPQDQMNQAAGMRSAAEQNSPMPPLPNKPESQMGMTGGMKLPAGVGPARPSPV